MLLTPAYTVFFVYSKLKISNIQFTKVQTNTRQNTLGRQRRVSYPVSIINYIIISDGERVHASMKEGGWGWGSSGVKRERYSAIYFKFSE